MKGTKSVKMASKLRRDSQRNITLMDGNQSANQTNECLKEMSSRFNRRTFSGIVAEIEMTSQFR